MTQEKVKNLAILLLSLLTSCRINFQLRTFHAKKTVLNILVKPWQITWKTSQKYYKGVSLPFNQYTIGLETLHYTYITRVMKVVTINKQNIWHGDSNELVNITHIFCFCKEYRSLFSCFMWHTFNIIRRLSVKSYIRSKHRLTLQICRRVKNVNTTHHDTVYL